jgi:PKD repeat protein
MKWSSLLTTSLGALALALPVAAQSPICMPFAPPWASNNGGTAGGVVMFDTTVSTAILVSQIDVNCSSAAGVPVSLEVYTCPVTWSGNEANPAAWTLVATDVGGALTAGREAATSFTLTVPWQMSPGTYGIGIRVIGSGQAYTGTGTGGTPIVVSTNELSLTGGGASSALFSGTQFQIRNWNGCLHYTPAAGLYPSFSATPTSGSSPLQVQFTDTTFTSDPNGVTAYAWDFDNNGTVDSTVQNPQHTYTVGGTYTVALTVTDGLHGSATSTRNDYIVVDPVSADFTATPVTGAAPLLVQFTDTSTGNPIAWNWDFDGNGTIDSTAQNPQHAYTAGGTFTVSLSVTNGANVDTEVKTDLIRVLGATNNTQSPELLEYQFNEPRGTSTANTAATTAAPARAVVSIPSWQGDPGRTFWQGNDPGYGAVAANNASPYTTIDTGWPVDITGSHTISFWTRPQATIGTCYPFGMIGGGSGRLYYTSSLSGYSLRSWGPVPITDAGTSPNAVTGWNHWAVVIDDAAGTAQWYLNGVADGNQTTFTPGTFSYTPGGRLLIGTYSTLTSTSNYLRYADLDDFRIYSRALTPAQILQSMLFESPVTSTFGDGCMGAAGVPQIRATGGAPTIAGNASFAIEASGMEPGVPAAINLGLAQTSNPFLPYDLSIIGPTYAGCFAEVFPDLVALGLVNTTGSATAPLAIPADPSLANFHFYGQVVVLGTQGAVSAALDINFK